ncbi:HEPN domain-containing protein [Frigoribacterium sp. PhB160]|uniref:ApeA N-terminal domain 1-containing protein n=1 Tax=Frigoribacterium sp. PhB160 TaxID=2485192 RepID=UPI000F4AF51D|nr:HEPN domain-containing protein [Frigoribacterium sp. PhB160]
MQPGNLTISDQGDITLDLVGGFDLSIRTPLETGGWAVSADERPMPLIHGRANNQDITLQEAWTRKSTTYGFGFSNGPDVHLIGANRAFIGTHIDPDEPAVWQGAWVQLENLVTWLGTESIRQSAEIRRGSAAFAAVPDRSVVVQDWTYTAVKRHGGFDFDLQRGDASVVGLTSTRLRIDAPSPCTIETLDEHVKAFMDLLTLAAGTACGVVSMSVIPARAPASADSRPQASNDIPTYVRHIHQAIPLAPAPSDWRFTCDDRPFEELVSKWVPLQRTARGGTSAYFGNYYDRPGYTESRALLTAIAAEATHRSLDITPPERDIDATVFESRLRRALDAMTSDEERIWVRRKLRNNPTSPSFRQRMRSILEQVDASTVGAIMSDSDQWLSDITKTRNGLAHEAVGLGDRLLELEQATDATVAAYLMALLGLNAEAQRRTATRLQRPY